MKRDRLQQLEALLQETCPLLRPQVKLAPALYDENFGAIPEMAQAVARIMVGQDMLILSYPLSPNLFEDTRLDLPDLAMQICESLVQELAGAVLAWRPNRGGSKVREK